jgi:hypothetical protein
VDVVVDNEDCFVNRILALAIPIVLPVFVMVPDNETVSANAYQA